CTRWGRGYWCFDVW
nr:immunoglobulin heavy chain junction region [Mus musculus]